MTDNHYQRKGWRALLPPPKWRLPVSIVAGMLVGFAALAFHISNASSYLSDDPRVCINCHIMAPHYVTWMHSSHREWATCNDCHVPQENFVRKYYFKAKDGMRHATVFTLRNEPHVIMLNEAAKTVVQNNCLRCHIQQMGPVSAANVSGKNYMTGQGKLCWDCHRLTPHGRTLSETSTPNAIIPPLKPVVPGWLEDDQNQK
ncbi:MAG: cytochrome c nitrite reductase small subunit [Candidatus Kapaibacterium sp.]